MGQAQNMLLFEAEKRKDAAFKQRTRSRENEQKALLTHNSSPATAYLLLNTKITKMHSLPFSVPSDAWLHFAGRCLGFKSFIRQRLLFVAAARGDRGWQREGSLDTQLQMRTGTAAAEPGPMSSSPGSQIRMTSWSLLPACSGSQPAFPGHRKN